MTDLELKIMGMFGINQVKPEVYGWSDYIIGTNNNNWIIAQEENAETKFKALDGLYNGTVSYIIARINGKNTARKLLKYDFNKIQDKRTDIAYKTIYGEPIPCSECKGERRVKWKYKKYSIMSDCPVCDGEGRKRVSNKIGNGFEFNDNKYIKVDDYFVEAEVLYKILFAAQQLNLPVYINKSLNEFFDMHLTIGDKFNIFINKYPIILKEDKLIYAVKVKR